MSSLDVKSLGFVSLPSLPETTRLLKSYAMVASVRLEVTRIPWEHLCDMWGSLGFSIPEAAPDLNILSQSIWSVGNMVEILSALSNLRSSLLAANNVIVAHESVRQTVFGAVMLAHLSELLAMFSTALSLYDLCEASK